MKKKLKKLYVISKFAEYGNLKPAVYANSDEASNALTELYNDYKHIGEVDTKDKHDNWFRIIYTDGTFTECQLFEVEIE